MHTRFKDVKAMMWRSNFANLSEIGLEQILTANRDSKCDNPTLTNQPTPPQQTQLQGLRTAHPSLPRWELTQGIQQDHPAGAMAVTALWLLQPQNKGEESWRQGAQVGTFAWGWLLILFGFWT